MTGKSFRACFEVFFLATLLVGCGIHDGGSDIDSYPSIANVAISPTTAPQNQGGGAINVNLTMNFADPGGDIASFTVNIYDQNNNQLSTSTYPLLGYSGVLSGTINGIIVARTDTVGTYTYKVFVTDNFGEISNVVAVEFTVTAPSTPP